MASSTGSNRKRALSDPDNQIENVIQEKTKKSAFPKLFDYCGYLDIRTKVTKSWKRKYFVLANNFLLMSSTPYSSKLEKVIPLEGSNVKDSTKTSPLSFEILIRKKRNQFRAPNETECNQWTEKIQRASKLRIKDIYRFDAMLGTNATGSTKVLSAKHRVTGEEVAVKVISKKEYNPKMLSNEVLILKRLDHPHVVKLFDLFETKKSVYLVMEKCNGGELFEQIANLKGGGGYSEKECITILHQIAKAVKYMHSMGIVHRDLKPENILCVRPNSIELIKIADFGISKVIFDPETRRREREERRKARKQKQKQKQYRTLKQREKDLYKDQFTDDFKKDDQYNNKPTSPTASNSTSSRRNKKSRRKKFIDPLAKKKKHHGSDHMNKHHKNSHHKKHRMSATFREYKSYDLMDTMCGTISYTAPEILKEKPYDKRVDYWSLGVIAFILLCGYPPFWGDTELDVAHSILSQEVVMDEEDWSHVSENGKKLVLGLLEKNPHKRLGVDDILKHTWVYASKSVNKRTRSSFIQTVAKRRIRKMSMGVFEKNSKRMDYLYRHHIDKDGNIKPQRLNIENKESEDSQITQISDLSGAPTLDRVSSVTSNTSNTSNSYSSYTGMSPGRESLSFSQQDLRRYSRTDDDLFELRLPSLTFTPRGSLLDNGSHLDHDEELGDDIYKQYNDYQNGGNYAKRPSRKYSQ